MRTSIKSGRLRAVSVTRLLLGRFDMMPVIIRLVSLLEKELPNKSAQTKNKLSEANKVRSGNF